ncbi:STAS domain-containing protein [Aquabacterium sp.]|uniref:STAS domain-containing protein n=1 Tax=Aquabacterium sp. TaxID=1872578 RepID=UPI003D6D2AAC
MKSQNSAIAAIVQSEQEQVLSEWLAESNLGSSKGSEQGRTADAKKVLKGFLEGILADAEPERFEDKAWDALRQVLSELSAARAAQGASAGETSVFVLSMKKPFFSRLQGSFQNDVNALVGAIWWTSTLVDKMAQFTINTYQRTREEIINRQQQELLELSTPVIKLWEGVLAVPMIGTLDSNRTQLVMETLLQRIVDTGSELAIIDITGVPTVDTLVAQHLLKTVTAIRLMGAECIISGIRPQIAQTIVHLGIDLQGITTKATLADALSLALKTTGYVVTKPRA